MDITKQFFVKCVGAGINNESVCEISEGVDFTQLYNLCISQSMSGIVLKSLENVSDRLDEKFYNAIQKSTMRYLARDVLGECDIAVLLGEFEKQAIKYLPLKGYHLKKLYPSTEMRYASDYDVLIDKKQLKQIKKVIKGLNLTVKQQDEHHDIVYFPESKTVIELHKTIFIGKFVKLFENAFEIATIKKGYKYFYEFTNEDFYISILAHYAYHFAESAGVGIRCLTDMYLYKKTYKLDYAYVDLQLSKYGLLNFKNEFEKLSDFYFSGKVADEFTLKLSDYVLESSILANRDKQNASLVAKNSENVKNKKGKMLTVFRIFFPKISVMKFEYPILKKWIILLPTLYIYRWINALFTRPNKILRIKQVLNVDSNEVEEVKFIRQKLGINDL